MQRSGLFQLSGYVCKLTHSSGCTRWRFYYNTPGVDAFFLGGGGGGGGVLKFNVSSPIGSKYREADTEKCGAIMAKK